MYFYRTHDIAPANKTISPASVDRTKVGKTGLISSLNENRSSTIWQEFRKG